MAARGLWWPKSYGSFFIALQESTGLPGLLLVVGHCAGWGLPPVFALPSPLACLIRWVMKKTSVQNHFSKEYNLGTLYTVCTLGVCLFCTVTDKS
jgi:hypothetical protein